MMSCETILELLPWYVIGKLNSAEAADVSAHMQACDCCREELADIVWLRHGMLDEIGRAQPAKGRVWRRVAMKTGIYDTARIDVGSLMIGLQLGLNASRRGAPVRASLRVMGQNVRIVGKKKGKECKTPETQ